MLQYLLFLSLLFLKTEIICVDIKVTLGKKIGSEGNEVYPVSLTLNEPLINKINPIDLFLVFDISSKMNIFHLKRLLNLIVDALDSEDKLNLFSFAGKNTDYYKEMNLKQLDQSNKERIKEIIGKLNNKKESTTNFASVISSFFNTILKKNFNSYRVQSVIFISAANNTDQYPLKTLKNLMSQYNRKYYTLHTLSFAEESNGMDLFYLSNYRDGSYYSVKGFIEAKSSVLNIIGSLKTTKYKDVNINVKINNDKYNIRTIFGYNFISNTPSISNKKEFNINILQFITGKDYTYIFLVDNSNNLFKNGESILKITIQYSDISNDNVFKNEKILYYYNSVNYFDPRKDELCRVRAFEAIYNYIINEITMDAYYKRIQRIREDCQQNLNLNFTDLMYDVYNFMEIEKKKNWILGSISEGYLKKGGINLWYSNSYQLELINNISNYEY